MDIHKQMIPHRTTQNLRHEKLLYQLVQLQL